ncbi:MAG: hypothetical protein AB1599_09450, partial [Planctomycetota bacterium]
MAKEYYRSMPDEMEELQPAGDGADTMAGGEAPLEDAGAVDVSDTMAESSAVTGQEEIPGAGPVIPGAKTAAPFGTLKPKSNIFTLLLILAFLCIGLAIYLLAHELNNYYGVTFGGILSEPNKTTETTEPAK